DLPELEPRLFSFNTPQGACPRCAGLGAIRGVDEALLVPDPKRSLAEGALANAEAGGWLLYCGMSLAALRTVCAHNGIPFDRPWADLGADARRRILHGTGARTYPFDIAWQGSTYSFRKRETRAFPGIIPLLEAAYRESGSRHLERSYLAEVTCPACRGTRLRPEALAVRFRGRTIAELAADSLGRLHDFFAAVKPIGREAEIGRDLLPELTARLAFLASVGLDYLTLDRATTTLAGGESQRIHLATQLGAGLRGVLYVLDEPSIGLHPRDNARLLAALRALRDLGNTVIVVEHDEETLRAADHIVDLGPGPGRHGGRLVAAGPPDRIAAEPASVTGQFLGRRRAIAVPAARRPPDPARQLVVRGAAEHNLQAIDVAFPLGCLTAVTGVSGSGKSTLVNRVVKRALARRFHRASEPPGRHRALEGVEHLDKVVEIDQTPIGRTPRSNPATYTKLLGDIRTLFAATPAARARGFGPGRFSFNVKGGRCEACRGAGVVTIEMQFLADVEVICDHCLGRRFNPETLAIRYNGKAIDDVLGMTVEEADDFFRDVPPLGRTLSILREVGLGYLQLGQSTTTLSGGEAQRVKLAAELRRPATGRTLYLLDEPTTGLHPHDVERLLHALGRLVDAGNTVVVIEHNLEVVKVADHVIDLGPEGGDAGGRVVATGTPEAIAACAASHTGVALRGVLGLAAATRPPARAPAARARDAGAIRIRGARQHNLKNIDVDIPHGAITVVTGVSGSGKTSLALDTLFAEGQRRFVESLSSYARRFLGRLDKAAVDRIDGLGPAIAIDQRSTTRSPRSTVATSTEIHDYLRLLYARLGKLHSPLSDRPLEAWSPTALARHLTRAHDGRRLEVLAPLHLPALDGRTKVWTDAERDALRAECLRAGFVRLRIADETADFRRGPLPAWRADQAVFLVVDRLIAAERGRARLAEAVETAYRHGRDRAGVRVEGAGLELFAPVPACLEDGVVFDEPLTPRHFSFNSHAGACPRCDGLGATLQADPAKVIVGEDRPLFGGALHESARRFLMRDAGLSRSMLEAAVRDAGGDPSRPWRSLPEGAQRAALHGTGGRRVRMEHEWKSTGKRSQLVWNIAWRGLLPALERKARQREEEQGAETGLEAVLVRAMCPECAGERLRPIPRRVRVGGRRLPEVLALSVEEAARVLRALAPPAAERPVAEPIVREILRRLAFLERVGLGYLTLDRPAATLSGGEAQRIRLATQIGSRLTGVNYVLDEPTIGLHPRDTAQLIETLKELRDLGNTVVVVEHDEAVIRAADVVVELGPGAGRRGGEVLCVCPPAQLERVAHSPTGAWLRRRPAAAAPRRRAATGWIRIERARVHNLQDLTVEIPRGVLTVVTGVSGSGKSTLVLDVLAARWRELEGAAGLQRLVVVDTEPIGATPASNPATYTGVFTPIRELYASLPESQVRGYRPVRFSFNRGDGRCEACEGRGALQVEMHFLSDVWITCDRCRGKRYNEATLAVTFKGRSIADVLDTEVKEALELFRNFPKIRGPLELVERVGLGYLALGQPAHTLSGGEAQRVKLATELARQAGPQTLTILDEPTIGLHASEVETLLGVLNELVDRGGSVVVIEHHPAVMRAADWMIDLGPEGGERGGRLVAAGTPETVAGHPTSHTARFLRE
ncbi:MAG: excinuclease ABC subunit UvrA, partial [Planctomycetes bacterium]|nr:excinuclease ABC subunit UvrA [Planctomycetota bacterium]